MRGRLIVGAVAALAVAGFVGQSADALSASPAPIDHGTVTLGKTRTKIVTVTIDAGNEFGFVLGAGASAPFTVDEGTCAKNGIPFRGPGTCKIKHTYTPTQLGNADATFDLYQCPLNVGTCTSVVVSTTATAKGYGSFKPTKIAYGDVALFETKTKKIKVRIDAGYQFKFLSPNSPPYSIDTGTCFSAGIGIIGPASCEMTHSFTPTDVGDFDRHVAFHQCPTSGPSNQCFPLAAPMTAAGVAALSASPKAVNYGKVAVGTTKPKTITFTIDKGYTFSSLVGGTAPLSVNYGTCISGGVAFTGPGTCEIVPTFAPTAPGPLVKNLTVRECQVGNTIICQLLTVPAKGTATP